MMRQTEVHIRLLVDGMESWIDMEGIYMDYLLMRMLKLNCIIKPTR